METIKYCTSVIGNCFSTVVGFISDKFSKFFQNTETVKNIETRMKDIETQFAEKLEKKEKEIEEEFKEKEDKIDSLRQANEQQSAIIESLKEQIKKQNKEIDKKDKKINDLQKLINEKFIELEEKNEKQNQELIKTNEVLFSFIENNGEIIDVINKNINILSITKKDRKSAQKIVKDEK